MAPPTLVVLNRSFEDPETPTAASFSINRNAPQHFSDNDYDEGDILDELLQEAPAVTPLSQEALRRVPAPSVVSVPDDSESTCSSATIGESYTDADANDDSSSITSVSVSESSSCANDTVTDAPQKPISANGGAGAGTGTGRRRRRRNRGGLSAAAAATSCASDAGSESPSVTARPRKNSARQRSSTLKAVDHLKDDVPSQPPTSLQPTELDQSSQATQSKKSKKKSKGHKSALVTEARRSRHPKLQIGLDLDVELQLKSKVRGDICLTLVLEETQNVVPRASPEIRRNAAGQFVAYDDWEDIEEPRKVRKAVVEDLDDNNFDNIEEVEVTRIRRQRPGAPGTQRRELCHLRVGRLNLTRRWWMDGYEMISHIPPPVVAGVAVSMPVAGFAVGWAAANWGGYWPW